MIVLPKSEAQSDRSRLRVVHKNRKKGRKTHPMSLLAADYLVLLTTLDAEDYPADRVIELYRMRWPTRPASHATARDAPTPAAIAPNSRAIDSAGTSQVHAGIPWRGDLPLMARR
jgi:hypothetical protein